MTAEASPAAMTMEADAFPPQTLQALQALALRYYANGLHEPCLTLADFLLRHQPAKAEHHRLRGKALHALGQYDQALMAYSRAVRLGLTGADLHLYIGQCLILLGRADLAADALQSCWQLAVSQLPPDDDIARRAQALLKRATQARRRTDLAPDGATPQDDARRVGPDRRASVSPPTIPKESP